MALRTFASRLQLLGPSGARLASSTPTVFDKMVQFFVIDKSGVRHTVRGIEGHTVAEAMTEYGQFTEETFLRNPYSPAFNDCHVYVSWEFLNKLPPVTEEQKLQELRVIEDYVRERARENSRLAHFIPLTPALNGLTVAIGEHEPWQTC